MKQSVTFRCLQSGNTVTFTEPQDIDSTRKHPEYMEVPEVEKAAGTLHLKKKDKEPK